MPYCWSAIHMPYWMYELHMLFSCNTFNMPYLQITHAHMPYLTCNMLYMPYWLCKLGADYVSGRRRAHVKTL